MSAHKFLNPSTMPAPRGYTHVVETSGRSRTIYLAGQLGMTPDGKFAGVPGDFRAQAAQAFENVKLGLAAVGATFAHVVKVAVYFTDMAHLQTYSKSATASSTPRRRPLRPRCRYQSSRATGLYSRSRR